MVSGAKDALTSLKTGRIASSTDTQPKYLLSSFDPLTNLFIASFRFDKPVMSLYRASLPFLGILLLALLFITYVPQLSLFLVELFGVM
jgi:hypothetical protein